MAFSIIGRGSLGTFGEDVLSLMDMLKKNMANKEEPANLRNSGLIRETGNVDITQIMGDAKYNRISQLAKYAIKTSNEALAEAGLKNFSDFNRVGVFMGTADGADLTAHKFYKLLRESEYRRGNPLLFPETTMNVPASYVSIAHKITGPIISNASDFTSGHEILEIAMNYLSYGSIDYALVVCTEEFSNFVLWKAQNEGLVASDTHGSAISGPKGTLFTAGASCLILRRGICDGNKGVIRSVSVIHDDNLESALTLAIDEVLTNAGLNPEEIDCVISQKNGTSHLDSSEENCLRTILSERTPKITLKSELGEQFGVSTLLNIIYATMGRQDANVLEMHRYSPQQTHVYAPANIRTILLTSLAPNGKCGALILEI